MMLNKWTKEDGSVHQFGEINGQSKKKEIVDLIGKSRCPFRANSRGIMEGTLPGKV